MSKTNKKRRIWIPILAVVLAAALVAGGVAIWRSATGKAVAVYPVMNIYDTYWGRRHLSERQRVHRLGAERGPCGTA